jgi:hypothetical protein
VILSLYFAILSFVEDKYLMNQRVIVRDWEGNALDREIVGIGKRVYYVAFSRKTATFPQGPSEAIGFPKDSVYPFCNELIGKRLSAEEWERLKPLDMQA